MTKRRKRAAPAFTRRRLYPLSEIKWQDAHGRSGWVSPDDLDAWLEHNRGREIRSVGYVIREDRTCVTLAQSYDHRESERRSADNLLEIPRGMIHQRRTLR